MEEAKDFVGEMSIPSNQSTSSQWGGWISKYISILSIAEPISLPRWKLGGGEIGAGEIALAWSTKEILVLCIFRSKKVAAPVSLPTLASTSGPASNELTATQPKVIPSVREWKDIYLLEFQVSV